ncbi:MAG: tetratricopeptide repeat protein, partial [Cyanobacteria bacterium J06642_2]
DWHLLRLVARSDAWGQITQAPGDYYPAVGTSAQEQFLDPKTQDVRVATAAEFVGRRRLLQRGLRQLRQGWGLMLHGLGGVGKSTVAARLLERLQPAGYEPVVMYRQLDEQKLLRRLSARQSELGQQCLQSDLPLEQRLTQFLARGLVEPDRKLCFILDDFEANIELRADGQPILKSAVVETLTALLQGLKRANKPHRLILTSRYDVTFPVLDGEIEREELAALQGAELEKKCQRLDAFSRQSQVAPELQAEARTAADGNPRLLEWLDKVLRELQGNVAEEILERVKAEEERFREEILAAALLEKQSEALKTILARGSIFRLPVPEAVMQEVWAIVSDAQALQQRAVALGLLEVSQRGRTRHLRVPQILQPLLPTTETDEDLWKVASDLLYRAWWEVETRTTEEQVFELLRLAEGAQQPERAAFLGNHIALRYEKRGRYREAIPLLQHALQIREEQLGASHPDTASSLNNLALLYDSTGKYAEAEPLYLRVLQIREEQLGASHPDTATSLNNLAGLYKSTGKYAEAEPLYLRALQIREEQLGASHPDTATSLNNLALLYDSTGKYAEAEPLYLRTIAIFMAALGENHPNTQTVFNNYVEMLQEAIEAGKAQEMLESGSDITRQILTQMLSADS